MKTPKQQDSDGEFEEYMREINAFVFGKKREQIPLEKEAESHETHKKEVHEATPNDQERSKRPERFFNSDVLNDYRQSQDSTEAFYSPQAKTKQNHDVIEENECLKRRLDFDECGNTMGSAQKYDMKRTMSTGSNSTAESNSPVESDSPKETFLSMNPEEFFTKDLLGFCNCVCFFTLFFDSPIDSLGLFKR